MTDGTTARGNSICNETLSLSDIEWGNHTGVRLNYTRYSLCNWNNVGFGSYVWLMDNSDNDFYKFPYLYRYFSNSCYGWTDDISDIYWNENSNDTLCDLACSMNYCVEIYHSESYSNNISYFVSSSSMFSDSNDDNNDDSNDDSNNNNCSNTLWAIGDISIEAIDSFRFEMTEIGSNNNIWYDDCDSQLWHGVCTQQHNTYSYNETKMAGLCFHGAWDYQTATRSRRFKINAKHSKMKINMKIWAFGKWQPNIGKYGNYILLAIDNTLLRIDNTRNSFSCQYSNNDNDLSNEAMMADCIGSDSNIIETLNSYDTPCYWYIDEIVNHSDSMLDIEITGYTSEDVSQVSWGFSDIVISIFNDSDDIPDSYFYEATSNSLEIGQLFDESESCDADNWNNNLHCGWENSTYLINDNSRCLHVMSKSVTFETILDTSMAHDYLSLYMNLWSFCRWNTSNVINLYIDDGLVASLERPTDSNCSNTNAAQCELSNSAWSDYVKCDNNEYDFGCVNEIEIIEMDHSSETLKITIESIIMDNESKWGWNDLKLVISDFNSSDENEFWFSTVYSDKNSSLTCGTKATTTSTTTIASTSIVLGNNMTNDTILDSGNDSHKESGLSAFANSIFGFVTFMDPTIFMFIVMYFLLFCVICLLVSLYCRYRRNAKRAMALSDIPHQNVYHISVSAADHDGAVTVDTNDNGIDNTDYIHNTDYINSDNNNNNNNEIGERRGKEKGGKLRATSNSESENSSNENENLTKKQKKKKKKSSESKHVAFATDISTDMVQSQVQDGEIDDLGMSEKRNQKNEKNKKDKNDNNNSKKMGKNVNNKKELVRNESVPQQNNNQSGNNNDKNEEEDDADILMNMIKMTPMMDKSDETDNNNNSSNNNNNDMGMYDGSGRGGRGKSVVKIVTDENDQDSEEEDDSSSLEHVQTLLAQVSLHHKKMPSTSEVNLINVDDNDDINDEKEHKHDNMININNNNNNYQTNKGSKHMKDIHNMMVEMHSLYHETAGGPGVPDASQPVFQSSRVPQAPQASQASRNESNGKNNEMNKKNENNKNKETEDGSDAIVSLLIVETGTKNGNVNGINDNNDIANKEQQEAIDSMVAQDVMRQEVENHIQTLGNENDNNSNPK